MKIQLMSDLHLEMGEAPILTGGADILVLSGDICVADHFTRGPDSPYAKYAEFYMSFFRKCKHLYPHVIYILGNHEHYHGMFNDTASILKQALEGLVTVLDNETITIDGVKFIGGTMWTNAHNNNPLTVETIQSGMSDYRVVQIFDGKCYRKLRAFDTMRQFQRMVEFIDREAVADQKCVVLTHHAPSELSIAEQYKEYHHMNGGYYSNLFDFIYDRPQIKLWTHGHVHMPFEYTINETTVACNPKGYPGESVQFNPNYVIDI